MTIDEKLKTSIERIKAFEPEEGYHLAFSGGKDSVVLKAVADMAGVKYKAVYRVTGIDPPELVTFIKEKHPDVIRDIPRYPDGSVVTMWNLIVKKLYPPTRMVRFCCQYLKEDSGDGRMTLTGVRWAESVNRKNNQGAVTIFGGSSIQNELANSDDFSSTKRGGVVLVNDNEDSRRLVESCYKRRKTVVNPLIEWEDRDIWEFIRAYKIPYCSLYDEGFHRLGCIGCPMGRRKNREREFLRWPKFKDSYIRAFGKMLERRNEIGRPWKGSEPTPQGVFNWWMEYNELEGQQSLFDEEVDR